ncbi:hypothetical protein GOP47_0029573 [Adiantum capillus-veneris]|nr:hypothetical protein GOP47_0029573 [Adiantum capillus-veneris]
MPYPPLRWLSSTPSRLPNGAPLQWSPLSPSLVPFSDRPLLASPHASPPWPSLALLVASPHAAPPGTLPLQAALAGLTFAQCSQMAPSLVAPAPPRLPWPPPYASWPPC